MIEKYIRDASFFRSLRDRNMTIAHSDLDNNFNSIVDYINKNLRSAIDILAKKELLGVNGNPHSFLRNIGDGNVVFSRIESKDIPNHAIELDKFIQTGVNNSLLASDIAQNIKLVKDDVGGKIFSSESLNDGLISKWSKITANNFSNNSITADKVQLASLTRNYLSLEVQNILDNLALPQFIEDMHIKENTIEANKIANGAFTMQKLSQELLNMRKPAQQLVFDKNCFVNRHFTDITIDVRNSFVVRHGGGGKFPRSGLWNIFTPRNIPQNAINLGLPNTSGPIRPELRIIPKTQIDNSIQPSHIKNQSLNLKILRPLVQNISAYEFKIKKQNLSNEFRGILESKGGLKK